MYTLLTLSPYSSSNGSRWVHYSCRDSKNRIKINHDTIHKIKKEIATFVTSDIHETGPEKISRNN